MEIKMYKMKLIIFIIYAIAVIGFVSYNLLIYGIPEY